MFNRMSAHSPLLIKFKNKKPAKLLLVVSDVPPEKLTDLINGAGRSRRLARTRLPTDDEFLVAIARPAGIVVGGGRMPDAVPDHALGEDAQTDVAHDGDTTPCHWRGPERSGVGDAAGDGGEVGMCRGEEVEADLGRENFLRERTGKEEGKTVMEGAHSYVGYVRVETSIGERARKRHGADGV